MHISPTGVVIGGGVVDTAGCLAPYSLSVMTHTESAFI